MPNLNNFHAKLRRPAASGSPPIFMPDEPDSSTSRPAPASRSWFGRITQAFSGEPSTREELLEELHAAHANGLLSADTLAMIEGALAVSDLRVSDVMVPRAQVVVLASEASGSEIIAQVLESGHSRFPVHGEDKDEVLGILLAKDLLRSCAGGGDVDIRSLLRPAVLIPESKRLNVLLKEFRSSRNHMAIVVDEHGGVAGLVTIEDVLEQIVGDIDDEHDDAPDEHANITPAANGQFLVNALTPIEDFNERFDADLPDDEFDTIGGLVSATIGRLPDVGDETTLGRFQLRVAQSDGRRVHAFHLRVLADE
jgi:magnesium and cobalt transporter